MTSGEAVCDLSVIILNWNTCELLQACLQSLFESSETVSFEVIVVDNASEDESREMVTQHFPQVRLLVNPRNVGFGAGNNAALPYARGRYLLFLNSDTLVTKGSLSALVRFADEHPDIGIVGPKLLNADGSLQYSCRRYPNLAAGLFRNTLLGRLFPNNRFAADYLMKDWDHASVRDVDWVSGAALFIRRELVEQIGGFDEDFYMYCEDVDLCWRATHTPLPDRLRNALGKGAQAHWRVVYFPEAVIYHYIGKSSDKVPTRMTYEFHRSQYIFYKKHYRASTPIWLRPLIPVGIMLRALGTMLKFRRDYWIRKLRGAEKPRRRKGSSS
ncbi:glycosyltransferase family 2 protein [Chthonomonas calidirosea]|uniref:glycosyltransferase family 2 protein n=1 Tax=Chthonomonas calidirosea TaxID=454171 RepID=UPI0006ECC458|nr:glycosyltransferase family 2 protein [Chthonomonas calidirosea]CEK12662.1 predicted glycosyltransferase [Chthonomonas calidirosea]